MKDFIDNMNSKKFIFALVLTILSFVLVLVSKLTAEQWIAFVGVVGGAYVVVNVSQSNNSK